MRQEFYEFQKSLPISENEGGENCGGARNATTLGKSLHLTSSFGDENIGEKNAFNPWD
jgi:hypothetical protein